MPYDPHVTNTAGESIARGIDEAGQAMAQGFRERREAKKNDEYSRAMLDYYHDSGKISPEEYAKGLKGSASTRSGIITGVQAEMHNQLVQQQQTNRNTQAQQHNDIMTAGLRQKQDQAATAETERVREFNVLHPDTTGQQPGSGPKIGSDPSGTGLYYFDGKGVKPKPKATLDAEQAMKDKAAGAKAAASDPGIQAIESKIQGLQQAAKSAGGLDQKPHWWSDSYGDQITKISKQRADMVSALQDAGGGDDSAGDSSPGAAAPAGTGTTGGAPATGSGTPAPSVDSTPTVSSQDQFDALSTGAVYKGADGKMYRKP